MKKILFVTCRYPFPITTGDALRANKQLNIIKQDNIVDLFCLECPTTRSESLEDGLNNVFINSINKNKKIINMMMGLFLKPLQCSMYNDRQTLLKFESILLNNDYDIIYFQLVRLGSFVQLANKIRNRTGINYKIALDFIDSLSLNMLKRSCSESFIKKIIFRRESGLLLREEKRLLNIVDMSIIISARDAKAICEYNLSILPNGIDQIPIKNIPGRNTPCNLVFFGNMGYYPNVRAAKNLVSKIYNNLDKSKYHIHIIGANPTPEILAFNKYDGVTVHGFVEDIYTLLNKMDISVFPIYDGSGMQNKVLESFMIKLPVITTSIVMDSFECNEQCAIIANSSLEFIEKIQELNKRLELRKTITENAKKIVDSKYNWAGIKLIIEKLSM